MISEVQPAWNLYHPTARKEFTAPFISLLHLLLVRTLNWEIKPDLETESPMLGLQPLSVFTSCHLGLSPQVGASPLQQLLSPLPACQSPRGALKPSHPCKGNGGDKSARRISRVQWKKQSTGFAVSFLLSPRAALPNRM